MTNAFAIQPTAAPQPEDAADDSPFAANADGDFSNALEMPDLPVGVLRGHVAEVKKSAKGYGVNIKCDHPAYTNGDPAFMWFGTATGDMIQFASALGATHTQRHNPQDGKNYTFFSYNGKTGGFDVLKGAHGFFIFAPYNGSPSVNKFAPKPNNEAWSQWAAEAGLSEAQLAALKSVRCGVIPGDKINLFE